MTTQHEKLRQIAWLILCLAIVVGLVVAPGAVHAQGPAPDAGGEIAPFTSLGSVF